METKREELYKFEIDNQEITLTKSYMFIIIFYIISARHRQPMSKPHPLIKKKTAGGLAHAPVWEVRVKCFPVSSVPIISISDSL